MDDEKIIPLLEQIVEQMKIANQLKQQELSAAADNQREFILKDLPQKKIKPFPKTKL